MNINHKSTGLVIRELCETRDSSNTFFEPNELSSNSFNGNIMY